MKIFTIVAVTIVPVLALLIAAPASAQSKRGPTADAPVQDLKAKKADEKAYKAALERIPESKDKYDPWGVARPAEPAKETSKDAIKEEKKP